MTKKKSAIIIIIIIIVISLAISIYIPNKRRIEEKITDNSISYYVLKRNEEYGVINGNGDIVIEPQYEEIIIPNQHKAVFIYKNEEESKVVNEKNQVIFDKFSNVTPIELTNLISETPYEKQVLKYEVDGKYGLVSIDGEKITDAKYEEISSFEHKEGNLLVKENNKYGVINDKGNQIIKCNYDSIVSDQYYSAVDEYKKTGYIVCNITDEGYRYGYYDYEGSQMLDVEYNEITRLIEGSNQEYIYLIVAKNGQYGVFINNNKIINTRYQSISYNQNMQMFIVEITGQYGAIDEKGNEILKIEYSSLEIQGMYIYAERNEEQKVFNKNAEEINIPFNTIIQQTSNSEYYIKITQDETQSYTLVNSNLEEMIEQKYPYLEYIFGEYFIATNTDGKNGIINSKGEMILDFNYDVIQTINGKNMIQAINFETNVNDIYNSELIKTLEIQNIIIQEENDYVKIYNDNEEYYLDNNGNIIEDEEKIKEIEQENASLRIKNFKRMVDEVGQYYYIEENNNET